MLMMMSGFRTLQNTPATCCDSEPENPSKPGFAGRRIIAIPKTRASLARRGNRRSYGCRQDQLPPPVACPAFGAFCDSVKRSKEVERILFTLGWTLMESPKIIDSSEDGEYAAISANLCRSDLLWRKVRLSRVGKSLTCRKFGHSPGPGKMPTANSPPRCPAIGRTLPPQEIRTAKVLPKWPRTPHPLTNR